MVLSVVVFIVSSDALCKVRNFAIPIKDEVPVYLNETRKVYEQPLFFVGRDDRLVVQAAGKEMVKIANDVGKTGWVESMDVRLVSLSQTFSFDSADVPGYDDLKRPILIPDADQIIFKELDLHRAFADELRQNVDKETITRQCGE